MSSQRDETAGSSGKPSLFPETRWSLVVCAQGQDDTRALRALDEICRIYWYPLYGFARSRSLSAADAEDATQSFFQMLFRRKSIDDVAENRGRLRAYFLSAMKNHLASRWREEGTLKRGGDVVHVPIDRTWAEEGLMKAEAGASPEAQFDRHWAHSLLAAVSRRLEAHYDRAGQREFYEAIKGCLQGDGSYEPGEQIAERLGMSPEAVRSGVFRLRRRFRALVEEEVAETCADPEDVRGEIAHLCTILAR